MLTFVAEDTKKLDEKQANAQKKTKTKSFYQNHRKLCRLKPVRNKKQNKGCMDSLG